MYDVYTVDLNHPRDKQDRIRMALVADAVPELAEAQQIGRRACLNMLESSGALETARGHVNAAPAYPNSQQLVKVALSLGGQFADMAKFWVLNQYDNTIEEHAPTTAELGADLRARESASACSGLAEVMASLSTIAGGRAIAYPALEAALQFFAGLRGPDWINPPRAFEVREGIGIAWRHTVCGGTELISRDPGRYSVVISGQRVLYVRTRNVSPVAEMTESQLDVGTPQLIADFFRCGRLPGERDLTLAQTA